MKQAELTKLYCTDKLSMQEIAILLDCSVSRVAYWKNKYGIISRNRSDASYLKHNKFGDPFKIRKKFSNSDLILYGIGLGLYWGEGTKADKALIRLANSDPRLLSKFIDFLKQICGVKDPKIKFWLQLFSDINKEKALNYWKQELSLSNFEPSLTVSPTQNNGSYKNRGKFGVLTVYVGNIKLRNWLGEQLEACRGSSVGRARHW